VEQPSVGLPPFHLHLETILFWVLICLLYFFSLAYFGSISRLKATISQKVLFLSGVGVAFLATTWPLHDISDGYLYSAHMVQHILLMLVVPPFMLWGTPAWLIERALPTPVLKALRKIARPVAATLAYNSVVALSHWPLLVDLMSRSNLFHQSMHLLIIAGAFIMWLPVYSPTPRIRRISPPAQMLYLFVQSILPTVPASFFTFAQGVIVPFYGEAPRLYGVSVLSDQQMAGFVMKVIGGLVIWTYLAVIFFRWYAVEGQEAGIPSRFRGGGGGGTNPRWEPHPGPSPTEARDDTDALVVSGHP